MASEATELCFQKIVYQLVLSDVLCLNQWAVFNLCHDNIKPDVLQQPIPVNSFLKRALAKDKQQHLWMYRKARPNTFVNRCVRQYWCESKIDKFALFVRRKCGGQLQSHLSVSICRAERFSERDGVNVKDIPVVADDNLQG